MHTPGPVACLAIPSLALRCALADRSALEGVPVALSDEAGTSVEDATREARLRGVREGMSLRDAVALCPALTVLEPRPVHMADIARQLIEAMEGVSPLVEEAAPGLLFADLRGTEALFPHPHQIERVILEATPPALQPGLGIAPHRFTAYAAARCAEPAAARRVEAGEERAFLASVPVDWLDLDVERIERMRLLGIRTCGELAALPRHAVAAQFGPAGDRAWLAACGADPALVRPRPPEQERVIEYVQAEPPLVSREAIRHALEQLLGRALRQPRATRRFVRRIHLAAESEAGQLWAREQVLREPLGDRARLVTVLRTLVEYAEFPGPIARLELELGGLTEESGRQASLFDAERTRQREQLDAMVRHLKVRFGESPVARVVPLEPWHRLPERRFALLEYDP